MIKRIIATGLLLHALSVFAGSTLITTARGAEAIRLAGRVDPLSLDIRLAQIESLLVFYRTKPDAEYLHEAELLASALVRLYPGNAQAWSTLAAVRVWRFAHTPDGLAPAYATEPLTEAIARDPLDVHSLELAMFYATVERNDLAGFKTLGLRRAALTSSPLRMICPLCGRHWLKHTQETQDAIQAEK